MSESLTLQLPDARRMAAAGAALGLALLPLARSKPVVVVLQGPLGAGKSTLARGLLRGLGYVGRVPSPTYTLVEPYLIDGLRVHHLDLYRLGDETELEFLGISDWIDEPGLTLVEWPERSPRLTSMASVAVHSSLSERGRCVQVYASTALLMTLSDCLSGGVKDSA
jgi:tRNA threonylcarbamoyladenosine biosynthesis protein TsaE